MLSSGRRLDVGVMAGLLLLAAQSAAGEVLIGTSTEPLVAKMRAEKGARQADDAGRKLWLSYPSRGWIIPFYKVDMTALYGSSTLFAVRNEGPVGDSVDVRVMYHDKYGSGIGTGLYNLAADEVKSVNVRQYFQSAYFPDLEVDADGFARGWIGIEVLSDPDAVISVDVFQVDAEENYATGSLAYARACYGYLDCNNCMDWQARFLKFPGSDQATVLKIWVHDPCGAERTDGHTVVADVYSERGDFVNSFWINTDEEVFEVEVHDYTAGVAFGSVELTLHSCDPVGIDPEYMEWSYVMVEHRAHGKYSVGSPAICAEPFPLN